MGLIKRIFISFLICFFVPTIATAYEINGVEQIGIDSNYNEITVSRGTITVQFSGENLVLDNGRLPVVAIQTSGTTTVLGEITIIPRDWTIKGTETISLSALQTKNFIIPAESTNYFLSAIDISGLGGDAKITIFLPTPHVKKVQRLTTFNPNIRFDFGEGIKITSGQTITIELKSITSEIGQEIDISWQRSN